MKITNQLEMCQAESSQKDQIITQLTQQNQKLEEQIREMSWGSGKSKKSDPTLQSNVKVVVNIQRALGHVYDTALPFSHPVNQVITDSVLAELKKNANVSQYSDQDMIRACATYFANQKKDFQRILNGTKEKHKTTCRRNNRKRKKLEERKLALSDSRVILTPEERELGQEVVNLELDGVSSDEDPSEDESDSSDLRKQRRVSGGKVRKVKSIPWRSKKMTAIIGKLDSGYLQDVASPASRRGRWSLIRDSSCPVSDRKPPENVKAWMLNLD